MKTLKLFNAVVCKESKQDVFVSPDGFIIEPGALWAKAEIIRFYKKQNLSGFGLNKSFYKSWTSILSKNRTELFIDQIKHYVSTYGSDFTEEAYIPSEVLDLPDQKIVFKYIKAISEDEMITRCLDLLESGIALKEETINDVLSILIEELAYDFTGKEKINNKEAMVRLAELYGILPDRPEDLLRLVVFKSTGSTLLIKDTKTIEMIKKSGYNPVMLFNKFGLERLAEVFNRFKPIFLAYKTKCSKTINKISKLSKTKHKALVSNPLNYATSKILMVEHEHWLDNATPYALFKALSACRTRIYGQRDFVYRIRNGKSFVKESNYSHVVWANYQFLLDYCVKRFKHLKLKKIFLPHDVDFALPTSEKMFVGNIPTGTKFYGDSLVVGVYWENAWGARDLDVSALNITGKIGWNSKFKDNTKLIYSGDITDAPNGAVEYMYAGKSLKSPSLIMNNIYCGKVDASFKIIGAKADEVNYNYMLNPENLFFEVKVESVQRQTILGILIPENGKQTFVVLNIGRGNSRVSGNTELSHIATKALVAKWNYALTFRELLNELGAKIVTSQKEADYDFSLETLTKDSFIKLFSES